MEGGASSLRRTAMRVGRSTPGGSNDDVLLRGHSSLRRDPNGPSRTLPPVNEPKLRRETATELMRCSPYMYYHGEDESYKQAQREYATSRSKWMQDRRQAMEAITSKTGTAATTVAAATTAVLPPALVSPPRVPVRLQENVIEAFNEDAFTNGKVVSALDHLAKQHASAESVIQQLLTVFVEPSFGVIAKPLIRLITMDDAKVTEIKQTGGEALLDWEQKKLQESEKGAKGGSSAAAHLLATPEYYELLSTAINTDKFPFAKAAVVTVTKLRHALSRTFDVTNEKVLELFLREMDRKRTGSVPFIALVSLLEEYLTYPKVQETARFCFGLLDYQKQAVLAEKAFKSFRGGKAFDLPPGCGNAMIKCLLDVWKNTPELTSTIQESQFVQLFWQHETASPRLVAGCIEAILLLICRDKFGAQLSVMTSKSPM